MDIGPERVTSAPSMQTSAPVDAFDRIIGGSSGLAPAVHKARLLTKVDAPLLLQGETGVGKEVFARAVHESCPHTNGPFVAVNCGGLPRDILASELFGYVDGAFTGARRSGMVGKIEAAHGGTLFLDEIGEMPLDLQPYLLRVLEGGEVFPLGSNKPRTVHFRLIAACNRDLREECGAGRFRKDLFYRISVTAVQIPPLREHREDIPALVAHFSRAVANHHGIARKRFSADVLKAYAAYSWPGNVRELRNAVEAMILFADSDIVGRSALPAELCAIADRGREPLFGCAQSGLKRLERDAIGAAIRVHHGNVTQVAKDLQISKSTLYLKMKKYALGSVLSEIRRTIS